MKNFFHILKRIVLWILIIITTGIITFTFVAVCLFDRQDRALFGYQAFIVLSDSMSKTDFAAGDLVVIKRENDLSTLKEGDIITFVSNDKVITHKIKTIVVDESGKPGFITYGTTTGDADEGIVYYSSVLGKYEFKIPKIGNYFYFLKTLPGYIFCVFLPFLLLILIQVFNSTKLMNKYKQEQMEEIEEERDSLMRKYDEILNEINSLKENIRVEEEKGKRLSSELGKSRDEIASLKRKMANNNSVSQKPRKKVKVKKISDNKVNGNKQKDKGIKQKDRKIKDKGKRKTKAKS